MERLVTDNTNATEDFFQQIIDAELLRPITLDADMLQTYTKHYLNCMLTENRSTTTTAEGDSDSFRRTQDALMSFNRIVVTSPSELGVLTPSPAQKEIQLAAETLAYCRIVSQSVTDQIAKIVSFKFVEKTRENLLRTLEFHLHLDDPSQTDLHRGYVAEDPMIASERSQAEDRVRVLKEAHRSLSQYQRDARL